MAQGFDITDFTTKYLPQFGHHLIVGDIGSGLLVTVGVGFAIIEEYMAGYAGQIA
jgi:hypothetical protein